MTTSIEARFWAKVVKTNECWNWIGAHSTDGYGNFWASGATVRAHRWSWEHANGNRVPEGLHLDHLCRNRECVNPDHLEPVTPAENARRGLLGYASPTRKRPSHCPQGHEYTDENTRTRLNERGSVCRVCKACERARRPRRVAREQEDQIILKEAS